MSKHTETPWEQQSGLMVLSQGHVVCRLYYKTLKKEAAEITFAEAEANAEFIIMACNMHDELVKHISYLIDVAQVDIDNAGHHDVTNMKRLLDSARDCLAKAEATDNE